MQHRTHSWALREAGRSAISLARYEATIETSLGTFADRGNANVLIDQVELERTGSGQTLYVESFREGFISDLLKPKPLLPTTKELCKDGGYEAFQVFKNQGDCVSFVETEGTNEPGQIQ